MKTYSAKPSDVEKKWFVIDAEGVVLGRLASVGGVDGDEYALTRIHG